MLGYYCSIKNISNQPTQCIYRFLMFLTKTPLTYQYGIIRFIVRWRKCLPVMQEVQF